MIAAHRLTKVFRDRKGAVVRAVDGVSFQVRPGQIYGLLGANGAGKTTTLRMLATLLRPTDGTALVAGHDIASEPQRVRAAMGFLAASTALYGRLTAREALGYFGRLNGLDEQTLAERVSALSAELGLGEFIDRRCDALSTGMKQRLSIARTLVHDPSVMIFDEPTTGLDVLAARAVLGFVRQCRDRGKTVVYSTHVMREAEKLCDVIGIVHGGRLLAEGTLAALQQRFGESDLEEIFVRVIQQKEPS